MYINVYMSIYMLMPVLLCQTDEQYSTSACHSALAYASFDGERVDVNVYVYVHIYIYVYAHIFISRIYICSMKRYF